MTTSVGHIAPAQVSSCRGEVCRDIRGREGKIGAEECGPFAAKALREHLAAGVRKGKD
jgi:hypothetical protein